MGYKQVKSIQGMINENRRHFNRMKRVNANSIKRMANINLNKSKEIAEKHKFEGTLLAGIELNEINRYVIRILSNAPHSYNIEKGIPPKRGKDGFISFESNPKLKRWVVKKLMGIDSNKANYFLNVLGGVFVGDNGFPYRYPKGIQFMELGFDEALKNADNIITQEIRTNI